MSTSLNQTSVRRQLTLRAVKVNARKTTLLERPMETSAGAIAVAIGTVETGTGTVATGEDGVVAAVEVAAELVPDAVSWA